MVVNVFDDKMRYPFAHVLGNFYTFEVAEVFILFFSFNLRMVVGSHQPNHLCSRQLTVPKRVQKPFRSVENLEKLKQLRKQQQNSGVEIKYGRPQFDH